MVMRIVFYCGGCNLVDTFNTGVISIARPDWIRVRKFEMSCPVCKVDMTIEGRELTRILETADVDNKYGEYVQSFQPLESKKQKFYRYLQSFQRLTWSSKKSAISFLLCFLTHNYLT